PGVGVVRDRVPCDLTVDLGWVGRPPYSAHEHHPAGDVPGDQVPRRLRRVILVGGPAYQVVVGAGIGDDPDGVAHELGAPIVRVGQEGGDQVVGVAGNEGARAGADVVAGYRVEPAQRVVDHPGPVEGDAEVGAADDVSLARTVIVGTDLVVV